MADTDDFDGGNVFAEFIIRAREKLDISRKTIEQHHGPSESAQAKVENRKHLPSELIARRYERAFTELATTGLASAGTPRVLGALHHLCTSTASPISLSPSNGFALDLYGANGYRTTRHYTRLRSFSDARGPVLSSLIERIIQAADATFISSDWDDRYAHWNLKTTPDTFFAEAASAAFDSPGARDLPAIAVDPFPIEPTLTEAAGILNHLATDHYGRYQALPRDSFQTWRPLLVVAAAKLDAGAPSDLRVGPMQRLLTGDPIQLFESLHSLVSTTTAGRLFAGIPSSTELTLDLQWIRDRLRQFASAFLSSLDPDYRGGEGISLRSDTIRTIDQLREFVAAEPRTILYPDEDLGEALLLARQLAPATSAVLARDEDAPMLLSPRAKPGATLDIGLDSGLSPIELDGVAFVYTRPDEQGVALCYRI